MNTVKCTALVVGAGSGGSTAAFYLAKAGVDVLLVDKETWPRDKICGSVYLSSLYPMLKEMGCFDQMYSQQACSITTMRLINRAEEYIVLDVDPFMIALRRFTDDQIRRAAIRAGADFMENYEAIKLIMHKGVVKGAHGCITTSRWTLRQMSSLLPTAHTANCPVSSVLSWTTPI